MIHKENGEFMSEIRGSNFEKEIFSDGQEDCYLAVFIHNGNLEIEAENGNGYTVGCSLNVEELEGILAELKKVE
jgi:hypothetical protein